MKFYQLTRLQRLDKLVTDGFLTPAARDYLWKQHGLPESIATHLTENPIGQYTLPLGVAPGFIINNKKYVVPMVTEEPSVIAAASHGAKMIAAGGGFTTIAQPHLVVGEVVFDCINNIDYFAKQLLNVREQLWQTAVNAHPSIQKYGGGLRDMQIITLAQRFIKIILTVDPQKAMGANVINSMCEAVAHYAETIIKQPALLAILSNQAIQSKAKAVVNIPFAALATKKISDGKLVAQKIVAASDLAHVDIQRAVTHNKGIMNGVDAVTLATGNDTRAVEASVQSFAAINGQYQALSTWRIQNNYLHGELTLPLLLGVIGGTISALPMAQISLALLQNPSVEKLMEIITAVGLAQNLAAIHALVTDGIQRGHMSLHANALAVSAGAEGKEISALVKLLNQQDKINLTTAKQLLQQLRQRTQGGK